jgi:hypothetical protein
MCKLLLTLVLIGGLVIGGLRWRRAMPAKRVASIPPQSRELFERWGTDMVRLVLTSGFHPRAEELARLYTDGELRNHAMDWLTERGIEANRHEVRIEIVEWQSWGS